MEDDEISLFIKNRDVPFNKSSKSRISSLQNINNNAENNLNSAKLRIAIYSHDTMGLGHIRRNFLIAKTLSKSNLKCSILLISGTNKANEFSLPENVDILTLPSLYKNSVGNYSSKQLNIPLEDIISIRSNIIKTAVKSFNPDIFIADKVPRGVLKELDPALKYLQSNTNTKCILGLRDILDGPDTVTREWKEVKYEKAIKKYYHSIWVYGDKRIYDLATEYKFSKDTESKICYTGYLVKENKLKSYIERRNKDLKIQLPNGRMILCLLGGGQDGFDISKAFVETQFPKQTFGVLLTGPFMEHEDRNHIMELASKNPKIFVYGFVPDPNYLLLKADKVIAMGGYNTICELISQKKDTLVIPRTIPRSEQLIRAQRLRDIGLFDFVHPDNISPQIFSQWVKDSKPKPRLSPHIDLDGLTKIPNLIKQIVDLQDIGRAELSEMSYAAK